MDTDGNDEGKADGVTEGSNELEGLRDGWNDAEGPKLDDGNSDGRDEPEGAADVVGLCDVEGVWDGS